jgi:hypothetical protein
MTQDMYRARRLLTVVEGTDAIALLLQGSPAPVFQDDWSQGFDYVCGHCKRVVLASCVVEDQLWDLAFQCFECNGVSMSPRLAAGMALPPRVVMAPHGRYLISQTVPMGRVVMVGQAAVERRIIEAGPKGSTFGKIVTQSRPAVGDADHLRRLIEDVRRLLGATFDALDLSDRLGRESVTPPKKRHPLMKIVHELRAAIDTFGTDRPTVDVRPVMELVTLLHTLERWRHHPVWPKMVQGLEGEYLHTAITLAAGSFLEDAGNGVVFQEAASGRTADLLLVVGAQQRVAVEVKVPQVLRGPSDRLGHEKWLNVVRSAIKGARTGEKGQLSRHHPGLLVLGGFYLNETDLRDFDQAATAYLKQAAGKGRHTHLMGIALLSFGTAVARLATVSQVEATLRATVAMNPGYKGEIAIGTTTPPSLAPGIEAPAYGQAWDGVIK